jgi:hypothetical protein
MSWMDDADIVPCGRCSKDVVMDHDPPCPHGWVACPECGWEAVCRECLEQARADMFQTGEYNERADPLRNHLVPAYNPAPNYHLAGGEWVRSDPMEGQR